MACERIGIKEKLRFKNIKPCERLKQLLNSKPNKRSSCTLNIMVSHSSDDHSIVTLSTLKDEPLSDFINANFINVSNHK